MPVQGFEKMLAGKAGHSSSYASCTICRSHSSMYSIRVFTASSDNTEKSVLILIRPIIGMTRAVDFLEAFI